MCIVPLWVIVAGVSCLTFSAKLNASLNSSGLSAPAVPTATKTRQSSVTSRAPEPPTAARRSISVQSRKPSESLTRPVRSTPSKKPDPTPVPTPRQTAARRSIAPSSSVQATKAESAVKGTRRLTGLFGATPSKGTNRSEGEQLFPPNASVYENIITFTFY